jgi:hypothetical protein
LYQYFFGLIIFGGGLYAVFKAYGDDFWVKYRKWIIILIWGFIYVASIHLFMTVAALENQGNYYFLILLFYLINVLILSKKIQ